MRRAADFILGRDEQAVLTRLAEESRDAAQRRVGELVTEVEQLTQNNVRLGFELRDVRIELAEMTERATAAEQQRAEVENQYAEHMATHEPPPPPSRMLVGAAVGGNSDPAPLEQALGRPLALRRTYYGSSAEQADSALARVTADHKAGRIPFISFKLPWSWADMAAGRGDEWCRNRADRLRATGGLVWLVLHHEPEGDGDAAAWTAMQQHCLPIFAGENVRPGICLTGYNQVRPTAGSPWTFEKLWPGDVAEFLAVDLYQRYGTTDAGLKWTPLDEFYGLVAAFAASVGVPWGTGETGVTDEAFAADPGSMAHLFEMHRKHGAEFLTYFSSSLNSKGSWPLAGDKLAAFAVQAAQTGGTA
jgi:hypothetical protein